ncbi:hypothetical protein EVAR_96939_1 [Eumeta japonica]|uniref:Uncharacterized protein n=1 Tax=Eumeta variegata TaxID=151549 RepID=A0A4C1VDQ6_EUMVA|nr:hypothetical protein EVAR_96939_1 [Eumeta japonica]
MQCRSIQIFPFQDDSEVNPHPASATTRAHLPDPGRCSENSRSQHTPTYSRPAIFDAHFTSLRQEAGVRSSAAAAT